MRKTKQCNECKKVKSISEFYYHRQRKVHAAVCKICSNDNSTEYQKNSGYRHRPKYVFYQRAYELKRRAKECPMTVKELETHLTDLWSSQQELCHYTGQKMELTGYGKTDYAMTVDRIDSSQGYVKGNMVLCLAIINRIKQNLSVSELKRWVSLIA